MVFFLEQWHIIILNASIVLAPCGGGGGHFHLGMHVVAVIL